MAPQIGQTELPSFLHEDGTFLSRTKHEWILQFSYHYRGLRVIQKAESRKKDGTTQ